MVDGSDTEAVNAVIEKQVDHINISSADELFEHASSRKPFVVRGAMKDWPLVKAAQKSNSSARDYILEFYEGRPCNVFRGHPDAGTHVTYTNDMRLNFESSFEDLSKIFDDIGESENATPQPMIYSGSIEARKNLPGIAEENPFTQLPIEARYSLWMGTKTRIPAHSDYTDNFACVAAGRRHFIIFPPEQYENLYLGPMHNTPAGRQISMVDFAEPDLEKFPRFRLALENAFQVTLDPGDLIFIPSMWWHQIEGLDRFNVLVNYWWHIDGSHLGEPEHALWHALWSIRDLPAEKRAFWKKLFDAHVFDDGGDLFDHVPEGYRGIHSKLNPKTGGFIRRYLQDRLIK